MNRQQLSLLCLLALSGSGFVLVQSKSIGDDAELASVDNSIDGPEESEATSSSTTTPLIELSTATSSTTSELVEPTKAPHNYTRSVLRALQVLRSSFEQDLKFESVKEARRFVKYAHLLPSYLAAMEADDSNQATDNKQLIGDMRKAMEEPRFKVGQQVSRKTMNKYRPLDRHFHRPSWSVAASDKQAGDEGSSFSLSRYLRSLYLLGSLKNKMNKDDAVSQILGRVYELKRPAMVDSLLEYAVNDTRVTLQRSELEKNDKLGCQIEILHPLCELTGTPKGSPQVPDTSQLLKLKEMAPTQLSERLAEVKVEPEVMKSLCRGVRKNLRNIALIRKYEKARVFEDGQLANRLSQDSELNFYYQLYDFCDPSRVW